ncbi:MAG: rRNA (cytosine1962-C5)-methyltransferase [Verrucomicrobiota bacterium]|jgi:23S rRNA (cytosine1962-C5)-methyltransferase
MKSKSEWIDKLLMKAFEAEDTNAYRLCTRDDGWVERFGRDVLISHKTQPAREGLIRELHLWRAAVGFDLSRVFARHLPKKNEERTTPMPVLGDIGENLESVAMEHSLNYKIDFGAGYSVGLFIDQRENRRFVRQTKPKRLLNCFAYTCSFSVAAAAAGAQTVNVDLSKKSLERGKENFDLNELAIENHKFIDDDVMSILPRLARKGDKFDMIILDPPTFSRSHRGKVFHVEKDYEELLSAALEVAKRNCEILISTNCSTLDQRALERMARYCLKLTRRAANFHRQPPPREFQPGTGASTIWMSLR